MSVKKILIIEDDQAILSALQAHLSLSGYECSTVNDPAAVTPLAAHTHPDLVILDVDMGNTDGFVILETLRAHADPHVARVPVIIASTSGNLTEISRGLQLGVADYFTKSKFNPSEVIEKIQKQIGISVAPLQTIPASSITAQNGSPARAKILIVEDDKFLRDLATQKLSKEDLQVFSAVDGEQGVAIAEREFPDIVLLDILLPGIDGFEVLRRLRANPLLMKTRIAMLSNFGQREDIEKALGAGADQFFIKANYTLDEIVGEVKNIISNPR